MIFRGYAERIRGVKEHESRSTFLRYAGPRSRRLEATRGSEK